MNWNTLRRSRDLRCALWVALCFSLASAVYLSWLYRLMDQLGGPAADWLSMVAGYVLQAAGVGLAALWLRREQGGARGFGWIAALFMAASLPALAGSRAAVTVIFGLGMNLLCGVIGGFYLHAIASLAEDRRGAAFGCGYGLATVAVGLLSLAGRGGFLTSRYAPLLYILMTAGAILAAARWQLPGTPTDVEPEPGPAPVGGTVALACGVVALLSLVKNLGFCFPSADIQAGLRPELSRIPYAIGLVAAGFIGDRSRKNGALCTVAALVIPFIMLGVSGEPVSRYICWGLDYLFYGFFSVFRVTLLMDLATRTRRWELAPMGLLMGRLGDAAGTSLGLLLATRRLALLATTAALFFPAVFLFFRLYRRLYEPEAERRHSEQEVFELFCIHNDLSAREREVLRMVLDNRANGEIAEALFITESTVKYHVHNVLQKTGCKNRTELQRRFIASLYPRLGALPVRAVEESEVS